MKNNRFIGQVREISNPSELIIKIGEFLIGRKIDISKTLLDLKEKDIYSRIGNRMSKSFDTIIISAVDMKKIEDDINSSLQDELDNDRIADDVKYDYYRTIRTSTKVKNPAEKDDLLTNRVSISVCDSKLLADGQFSIKRYGTNLIALPISFDSQEKGYSGKK